MHRGVACMATNWLHERTFGVATWHFHNGRSRTEKEMNCRKGELNEGQQRVPSESAYIRMRLTTGPITMGNTQSQ